MSATKVAVMFVLAVMLLAGGCLGGTDNPLQSKRAAVDDACYAYMGQTVETLISFIEMDRGNGWSYSDEIMVTTQSCFDTWGRGTIEATACIDCAVAAIKYVYGVD